MNNIKIDEIKWNNLESYDLSSKDKTKMRLFLLNSQPPSEWLKKNPMSKNYYLPIDKIEYLLTMFFGKWYVEIKDYKLILNSMTILIRLFYLDPDTNEYEHQDGGAAWPVQVKKDTDYMQLTKNMQQAGITMALPIAKSLAIKDAADHIGRIFGRDVNRKNIMPFNNLVNDFKNVKIIEK